MVVKLPDLLGVESGVPEAVADLEIEGVTDLVPLVEGVPRDVPVPLMVMVLEGVPDPL